MTAADGYRLHEEEQLVARCGDGVREHFTTARARTADWTADEFEAARREVAELDDRAVALLEDGATPGDPRVTALVADHHASVSRHWTPDAVSCTGLGRWYVEDPAFRERFDARHPGLAVFWCDALAAWATAHLA